MLRALATRRSLVVALAPAPPRSLGDEVILRGFLNGLNTDTRDVRFVESSGGKGSGWANVLGVGREGAPLSSRIAGMAHLPLFARAAQVYVLGADVLDGHYSIDRSKRRIQFARLAERAGAAVSIVSYSLNANPEFAVIDEWRRLPASVRLVSRDSKSAARSTKFLGREAVLGADLAFLAANGMQASTSSVLRGSLCLVPNSSLSAWCGGYETLWKSMHERCRHCWNPRS